MKKENIVLFACFAETLYKDCEYDWSAVKCILEDTAARTNLPDTDKIIELALILAEIRLSE